MNYSLYDTIIDNDINYLKKELTKFINKYGYDSIIIRDFNLNDKKQLYVYNLLETVAQIIKIPIYFDVSWLEFIYLKQQLQTIYTIKRHTLFCGATKPLSLRISALSEHMAYNTSEKYRAYDNIYDDIYDSYFNKERITDV